MGQRPTYVRHLPDYGAASIEGKGRRGDRVNGADGMSAIDGQTDRSKCAGATESKFSQFGVKRLLLIWRLMFGF